MLKYFPSHMMVVGRLSIMVHQVRWVFDNSGIRVRLALVFAYNDCGNHLCGFLLII